MVRGCLVFVVMMGCSTGGTTNDAGTNADVGTGDACSTDPLETGLVAMQTGVSVDAFDCQVLKWAAYYSEPDPMIFKAIMYVESRFADTSSGCTTPPCGIPNGWTAAESGCLGLMQIVPACGSVPGDAGLLGNGQPNMTMDPTQSGWATSIFNPDINIDIGISGVASNRMQVMQKFPGCTTDQYTMMAVGDYNNYGSTKSCTQDNTTYNTGVLAAYTQYATAAGYAAHSYTP
jgi:Transglycosylase SLT domain